NAKSAKFSGLISLLNSRVTTPIMGEITKITVRASERLELRPECNKLLSGFWGDARKTLDKLWADHKIRSGNLNQPPGQGKVYLGDYTAGTITLDTKYGIQDPAVAKALYGLGAMDALAANLLHEVGHATAFLGLRHLTQGQSDSFNQRIADICFK